MDGGGAGGGVGGGGSDVKGGEYHWPRTQMEKGLYEA